MTDSLELNLTKVLVELLFQIEMAEDSLIDSDYAIALMENVGASLQKMEDTDLAGFAAIIGGMAAAESSDTQRQYLLEFLDNFGLSGEPSSLHLPTSST